MSSSQLAALNLQTALVDKFGKATTYLAQFMRGLTERVESAAFVAAGQIFSYSAQNAAIVTTALVASVSAPLYLISYDLRISLAAGATSAAQVTIGWTEGAIPQTHVGQNVNGNTTTSKDTGRTVFQIRPDAGTVITVAVSYASTGAPSMEFSFDAAAQGLG